MKRRLINLIRLAVFAALMVGLFGGMQALIGYHFECCPELYEVSMDRVTALLPIVGLLALLPFAMALYAAMSGYRVCKVRWFFLEFTAQDKLRVRLTGKLGFGAQALPPRTDGTSPYVLYWLSGYIFFWVLTLLLGLLTVMFWRNPISRYLNIWVCAMLAVPLMVLLPSKRNPLDRVLAFRKSRDLLRAWECMLHMNDALEQDVKLQDMPDEWFLAYPEALKDHPFVRVVNFNRASRLIDQERYAEGYEVLRYFFDLTPAPDTHLLIAGAIINGAPCEAMADLPPMCLSQLDHPSMKLPMPPNWERPRLFAEYARALFLHHDEAEAAAILPKLTALIEKEGKGEKSLARLQEKCRADNGLTEREQEA